MSSHARLLVVDDRRDNVILMTQMLRSAGYSLIQGATSGFEALEKVATFVPDLVLLDLEMDGMDGLEVLSYIRRTLPADSFLPVLIVTASHSVDSRQRSLSLGATDFLHRPFVIFDVILRVRNLLQTRFLHLELLERNAQLETQCQDGTARLARSEEELRLAQLDVIDRLALAGEYHDDDTGAHTRRVANTSRLLGQHLGLQTDRIELLRRAAPLHDVGKISVSDTILLKPGKLMPDEFAVMKTHCERGADLLNGGRSEMLKVARAIALTHHERFDGKGYPRGINGQEIPIEGRITSVADVFDALTHSRPYKIAWPVADAVQEIRNQRGAQFDPEIVDAFLELDHDNLVSGE